MLVRLKLKISSLAVMFVWLKGCHACLLALCYLSSVSKAPYLQQILAALNESFNLGEKVDLIQLPLMRRELLVSCRCLKGRTQKCSVFNTSNLRWTETTQPSFFLPSMPPSYSLYIHIDKPVDNTLISSARR